MNKHSPLPRQRGTVEGRDGGGGIEEKVAEGETLRIGEDEEGGEEGKGG